MPYDPQRSHSRRPVSDEEPAPVDALLAPNPGLPEGVEVERVGDEIVVHTADADVEVTATGDDVVVRTADAEVEVRPEADEVVVSAGREDIYVDLSGAEPTVGARPRRGRTMAVATLLALLAVLAVLVRRARRRAAGSSNG